MALNANVNLNVPALDDTGIAFVNAQAWSNYWNNVGGVVSISVNTNAYNESVYDDSIPFAAVNINGIDYALVTVAMFTSLKTRLDTLNTEYKTLKLQLKNAGLITTN